MFDAYFCPRVAARLRSRWHAAVLEDFLAFLHGRGHFRLPIQGYVRAAEVFLQSLRLRGTAVSVRSLLRWLQFHGHLDAALPAVVPVFRRWRHATVPPVLTGAQCRALLAAFDRRTPVGRRDYALTLCLMDLGLRVGEVVE